MMLRLSNLGPTWIIVSVLPPFHENDLDRNTAVKRDEGMALEKLA